VHLKGGTLCVLRSGHEGPRQLRVTGELADGTLPYLAVRANEDFIVPTIGEARAAGRPARQGIAAVR